MILAGDAGGTKTILGIYRASGKSVELVRDRTFASQDYSSLEVMLREFLAAGKEKINRAAIGVAGPVAAGKSKVVNLPWSVDRRQLSRSSGIPNVLLLNDIEAAGWAIGGLGASRLRSLTPGVRAKGGNGVLVAPGTGLGVAGLLQEGDRYRPFASEAGHQDFSPRDEAGNYLRRFLATRYGEHVSVERVLSGKGFQELFEFVLASRFVRVSTSLVTQLKSCNDPNALISESGMKGRDPAAKVALDLWVTYLGTVCGDLALSFGAVGGVWIGGGIVPKILPALKSRRFLEAFRSKGRMKSWMGKIPIRVIIDPQASLRGAALYAAGPGRAASKR
jgi:glucokinase